jgi:hypothetical protein
MDKPPSKDYAEVSSPAKSKKPRSCAKQSNVSQGQAKDKGVAEDGKMASGHKRKSHQQYCPKAPILLLTEDVNPLAMVVHQNGPSSWDGGVHSDDNVSNDSNKKKRNEELRSTDQAGAVEQPRRMQ